MTTASAPASATPTGRPGRAPGHGATAYAADAADGAALLGGAPPHSRHLFGDALRVVKVFGETVFRVAVLGDHEARRTR